ncbi:MAG: OB-fold nucleic acid binding domain-containing protein, partial [Anaerolineae bacterium]|nr:OB-fold nucleic acid binding domain-containing protein [Anaerolineae bacterium]
MPPVIRANQLADYDGQEVTLQGWIYNRTHKGKLVFLLVRDGYGFVQCVAFERDLIPELFEGIVRVPQESSVRVSGVVRADRRAPGIPGGYEIGITALEIVQAVDGEYPIA